MPSRVLLVHGYSVQQLKAYGQIPALLAQNGFQAQNVYLSAYVSLDDRVSCNDLATALESHITAVGITDDLLRQTAIVCHSTGAIVARRWMLNRLAGHRALPSHLVTLAGANHGSTLAQIGRTAIARVFRTVVENAQPGVRVLADLDYGSPFLWSLNAEWLKAWNDGILTDTYCFAMGGDKHWVDEIPSLDVPGWQFQESGSDSIVRISGANLNSSFVTVDAGAGTLQHTSPSVPVAHLVIHGYTHGGILGGIHSSTEAPFQALLEALAVTTPAQYETVCTNWKGRTNTWATENSTQVNSTIVFRLRDQVGQPINDSWIVLRDPQQDARGVTLSLCAHQPIQNETDHSVVSFYVDCQKFGRLHPHSMSIDARSDSPNIDYRPIQYALQPTDEQLVRPNEFTYVDVTIPRDVTNTYAILTYDPARDVNKTWPPLVWDAASSPVLQPGGEPDETPGPGNR